MHVIGVRLPDEQWRKMEVVYHACVAAGIAIPEQVREFFGWQKPNVRGAEVEVPMSEWFDEDSYGYEVVVKDLPSHVTVLRLYTYKRRA